MWKIKLRNYAKKVSLFVLVSAFVPAPAVKRLRSTFLGGAAQSVETGGRAPDAKDGQPLAR
ncbi:hypothetical protein [Mesorhizobium sp. M0217]|uniref:hypothetical protein n=1 Tax=unclassified Mesorhizobium TaxID=325217 RepID=UPI00333A011B